MQSVDLFRGIPEVKFKAQPDKVKKDIKIQKWVFMSFFAFWEFSAKTKKGGFANPNKETRALGTRITDIFCIFYRRKAFISFLFYVLISAEISVSAYP